MHNPNIRYADETDIPRIRAIMDEAVAALPSRDWYVDDDETYLARHIREEGYILLFTVEGVTAGFLVVHHPGRSPENLGEYLHLSPEEMDTVVHMESAAVSKDFQGRHIQQQLIEEAILIEKENGQTAHLMATVHPDNVYSMNTMLRCGFTAVVTLKKYGDWVRTILHLAL